MKKGDNVYTPRFCTVTIEKVFNDYAEAVTSGYTEPTHYNDGKYGVLGKSIDQYTMEFVAYKR